MQRGKLDTTRNISWYYFVFLYSSCYISEIWITFWLVYKVCIRCTVEVLLTLAPSSEMSWAPNAAVMARKAMGNQQIKSVKTSSAIRFAIFESFVFQACDPRIAQYIYRRRETQHWKLWRKCRLCKEKKQFRHKLIIYIDRPTKHSLPLTKLTNFFSEWKVG